MSPLRGVFPPVSLPLLLYQSVFLSLPPSNTPSPAPVNSGKTVVTNICAFGNKTTGLANPKWQKDISIPIPVLN